MIEAVRSIALEHQSVTGALLPSVAGARRKLSGLILPQISSALIFCPSIEISRLLRRSAAFLVTHRPVIIFDTAALMFLACHFFIEILFAAPAT